MNPLIVKKLPWLSLVLLFAAYSTFSWFLIHATHIGIGAWIVILLFTLLQALLLTTWFDSLKRFISLWLRSDVGYFTLIIVSALGFTMALVWFKTFGYFLVLVSAELLARLDLQHAGINRVKSLFVLTIVSLAGLGLGWIAAQNPIFRPTV